MAVFTSESDPVFSMQDGATRYKIFVLGPKDTYQWSNPARPKFFGPNAIVRNRTDSGGEHHEELYLHDKQFWLWLGKFWIRSEGANEYSREELDRFWDAYREVRA